MYGGLFSTESLTFVYSEFKAYSIPCQIFDGKFYLQPCVTLVYLGPFHI